MFAIKTLYNQVILACQNALSYLFNVQKAAIWRLYEPNYNHTFKLEEKIPLFNYRGSLVEQGILRGFVE